MSKLYAIMKDGQKIKTARSLNVAKELADQEQAEVFCDGEKIYAPVSVQPFAADATVTPDASADEETHATETEESADSINTEETANTETAEKPADTEKPAKTDTKSEVKPEVKPTDTVDNKPAENKSAKSNAKLSVYRLKARMNVREFPSLVAPRLRTAPAGTLVQVFKIENDWLKIKNSNNTDNGNNSGSNSNNNGGIAYILYKNGEFAEKVIDYIKLSPNHSGLRTHAVDRITPHCVVGQFSVEDIANFFLPRARQASSNYGIGKDGRVGMYVEEQNRSWCSSSRENDQRAITIECASDKTPPYAFNDSVYNKLIELCTDICKRHGKKKLLWLVDKVKSLNYIPAPDEMVLTVHRWFSPKKSCPGDWMFARMGDLAEKVTRRLSGEINTVFYRVRKSWDKPNTQIAAFTQFENAKNCVDCNSGYSVFDEAGNKIYPAEQEREQSAE